ncbi:sigma-70 family RNA polymerase sigma factor [uncultured Bacteroides sp.]|uniref:RNA polymerase sigma factor n=1 Tax=uncultured Bacteroides sp. TaxID=162156 RepID=UPI002AABFC21|nr:sigma-70 family RNA polymerase sigma factor [uncultured Bacteroides sp.]
MSANPTLLQNDSQFLWNRFFKGDDDAFTLIYNQYVNQLMAYGMGWGFNKEVLKDAIQDVFCKLYFNRKAFEGVSNPKFYLIRALKNRILDMQKKKMETVDLADIEFSITPTVLDTIISEEERTAIEQQIQKYLNLLTGRQREAVYLRFIEEMEYEEIAEILEMTAPAVRKLVSRAITRIRTEEISLLLFYLFSKTFN